jgi:hypothetical protein
MLAAVIRPKVFKTPEHAELSISRLRTLLSSSSIDDGFRLQLTATLEMRTRERFERYGLAESLDEANSCTSKIVDISQSLERSEESLYVPGAVMESYSVTRMAETIQRCKGLLSTAPPGTERHTECLASLARWYR